MFREDMSNILFSIITICLNAEKVIYKTINSVITQTNKNYEYIIVDGLSKDHTIDIVYDTFRRIKEDNIKVISEPDDGISDAFNKGIHMARGKYLLFLNAGDFLVNDNVLDNVERDINSNDYDILGYSISTIMYDSIWKTREEAYAGWNKALIPHQASFIKKELFEKFGLYNLNYKVRMDFEFFARCLRQNVNVFLSTQVICRYDVSGISATNRIEFYKEGLAVKLLYNLDLEDDDIGKFSSLCDNIYNGKLAISVSEDITRQFTHSDKIILFGVGFSGYLLYKYGLKKYYNKLMLCDNKKAGILIPEYDLVVNDFQEILRLNLNCSWIISIQAIRSALEVFELLTSNGIDKDRIFFYDEQNWKIC